MPVHGKNCCRPWPSGDELHYALAVYGHSFAIRMIDDLVIPSVHHVSGVVADPGAMRTQLRFNHVDDARPRAESKPPFLDPAAVNL